MKVGLCTFWTVLLAQVLTSGVAASHAGERGNVVSLYKNIAMYGNYDADYVYVIDLNNMSLITTISTEIGPYPVDVLTRKRTFAITRKTPSLTLIDNYRLTSTGIIPLLHRPRSTAYNPFSGLAAVSGGDKPMTSIIRVSNGQTIAVVGWDEVVDPSQADYGGTLATGHPYWVCRDRFLLLDRYARMIHLFDLEGELLDSMATPTSVHHIIPAERGKSMNPRESVTLYGLVEGNQVEPVPPAIIRFEVTEDELTMTGQCNLPDYGYANMGAHHGDLHPDGVHIYAGSAEGHTFVVDRNTMDVVKVIDTGAGNGHTHFIPDRSLAVAINHDDTFVSVIDTETHSLLKNIEVTFLPGVGRKAQGHTTGVSPDQRYFYGAASDSGVFFEIDLDTLQLSRTLFVGGYPLMGSFFWDGKVADGM
jgi:DNA-binding beta-propeller fold protein YncE